MSERELDSHKGENGKVLIVGGSPKFYGAPILCSLGAENSGVDLVFPYIPKEHVDEAKTHSLNFIISTFKEPMLTPADVNSILKSAKKVDVVVMGPGLGTDPKTQEAIKTLLRKIETATVVDASALIYTNTFPKITVLTPHRGEFKALTGADPTADNVQKWAKDWGVTIVCKGPEDIIADNDELAFNETGNSLMTVGGTGDVLSGFIGGLIAQGLRPFDAARFATKVLGKIAEDLAHTHTSLKAIDLATAIPTMTLKS